MNTVYHITPDGKLCVPCYSINFSTGIKKFKKWSEIIGLKESTSVIFGDQIILAITKKLNK